MSPDNQIQSGDPHERAKLLLEINNAVVSNLDLRGLLKNISVCLRRIINHDFAALLLYDLETKQLRVHALDFEQRKITVGEGVVFPMEGTPSGVAFKTRKTVIVNKADLEGFSATPLIQILRAEGVQSGCSVPLISHNRVFGVLSLMSLTDGAFTREDAGLLEEVVAQIAIAVDNALNYQKAKYERDRFAMLSEASQAVSASLDLREVLQMTSTVLRKYIHHDLAGIALYDEEINMFRVLALDSLPSNIQEMGNFIPVEGTPDGIAFKTKQPVLVGKLDLNEFNSAHMKMAYEAGIRSGCSVPLISRDRAIGVLAVASNRENSLTPSDAEILQLIANQIAGAVENALQYNEIEELKNKLTGEKLYLEEEIQSEYNFAEIVGHSQTLKYVLHQIETVAPTDSCVLIGGETGTGKELIARAIHNLSRRRERIMVKLNCSAIPTGLLESELFGHEKGAFTGAATCRTF